MNFSDGLENVLLARDLPVVTFYDFYVLGHQLFHSKAWKNEPLKRMPHYWDQLRAKNAIRRLEARRALVSDSDFTSGVWRIADPFAYVSHLSAMQRYGLSDRSPQALHLTTPKRDRWNALRSERALRDLPEVQRLESPILNRPGFRDTIRRRPVVVHVSSHPWTPSRVSGEETRITSIGQTFADMLTEPSLCGGMHHVLDVWENEASQWVQEITAAIDQLDVKIVKVRAGYILSEVMDIDHPALHNWEKFAQRGGSRKLDPDAEYAPEFSERWMISINV